jgi:hypothetical protein
MNMKKIIVILVILGMLCVTTCGISVTGDGMDLVFDDMVDAVNITKNPGTCNGSTRWLNSSEQILIEVFGSDPSDHQNATINITGCGLDFTIDENNPSATDECVGYPGDGTHTAGQYLVEISPKTAGTLTVAATNGTMTVEQIFQITGLTGAVTTSIGDDLEITVDTTETITMQLITQYASVYLTYFDLNWTKTNEATISLNHTVGDGTVGNGEDGTYTFRPDVDNVSEQGYIVVAAEAGSGNFFYEIIEIVPNADDEVEANIVKPIERSIYVFNELYRQSLLTVVIGGIDIIATVQDPLISSADTVNFFVNGELIKSTDYDTSEANYSFQWNEKTIGRTTIKVAVNNSEEQIASDEIDVFMICFGLLKLK